MNIVYCLARAKVGHALAFPCLIYSDLAEWQKYDRVMPFQRLRRSPGQQERFDDVADGAPLRNDEQARIGFPGCQPIPEVSSHRLTIMRDDNPPLPCRKFEDDGILGPS